MEKNYYKILEVDFNASPEVIEKAYKTLAKKYHPDLQEENQKVIAGEKLKEINEAYEVLSNPQLKSSFDAKFQQSFVSREDFNKVYMENEQLYNEINSLRQQNNTQDKYYHYNVNNSNINSYNSNSFNTDFSNSQQDIYNKQNQAYINQLEYQAQMQAAREKAYHDAYIQDLKNRGYRIKYKKTPKDIFKNIIALILTVLIVLILFNIPFVKNYLSNIFPISSSQSTNRFVDINNK